MGMLDSLMSSLKGFDDLEVSILKPSFAYVKLGSTRILQAYEKNNVLIVESCITLDLSIEYGKCIAYDITSIDEACTDAKTCIQNLLSKLNSINSLEFITGVNLDSMSIVTDDGKILADVGVNSNGLYCDIRFKEVLFNKLSEGMVKEVCELLEVNPGLGLYYNYN